MSDIFQQLLSSPGKTAVRPELLEAIGNQAAAKFMNDEPRSGSSYSLNELIRHLASEHPGLENEHIKRIAEFANNAVFQKMHASEEDKNVHFELADPGVIIRDLKDGGSPAHDGKTLSSGENDYTRPPSFDSIPPSKNGFADLDSGLEHLFQRDQHSGLEGSGDQISKTASAHSGHANPVEDLYDYQVYLRAAREKIATAHEQFDLLAKQAEEDFYLEAKRQVLDPDGVGLPGVIQAVKLAAQNDSLAFQVLKPVAERLVKEGAVRSDDMQKRASGNFQLNYEHPLIQAFSGLVKAAAEKVRAYAALQEMNRELAETSNSLREQMK